MTKIDISIVILTKNEERYIGSTLDVVFRQDIDKKYEVIVIDSGSSDSTLEIVNKYSAKILKIPEQEFGHGRTRNKAAQLANGEILVFLNADATPINRDWLKSLISNFKNDKKIVGVYSRVYPRPNCNPLRFWEILNEDAGGSLIKYIEDFNNYQHMKPRNKRKFLAFKSISCAIRRNSLLKYPFENIEFGEDLEWSRRVIEHGFKIVYERKSIVLHSHNFYCSFIKTFKKYFDDAKLNNYLLNIWSWRNFPVLVGCIIYKIISDISYILSLNKNMIYKTSWIFFSPAIRLAEFIGTVVGVNSQYLPRKLHKRFSLVSELKRS
ncbi:MAG: glycosyltransferase family 2 protein [Candidatus Omnitrophota bacterium]|jgi:rhamnosyltransferase